MPGEIEKKDSIVGLDAEKNDSIMNTKESLRNLENETHIDNLNNYIDRQFNQFKVDLQTDTKPKYDLRWERNLEMEKVEGWKLKIKSYGEVCELDLQTGKFYYEKWWELIEVLSLPEPILKLTPNGFELKLTDLGRAFWKMNVINRAMSMAKTTDKKDFYFKPGGFRGKSHGGVLQVDGKNVISFNWIKHRFGDDITKEWFLDMLNKVVL